MPILKRRLDICGREKVWEYVIESAGSRQQVTVRQHGREEPAFSCSCGGDVEAAGAERSLFQESFLESCVHIAEVQRDLSLARHAAAQMLP